MTAPATSHYTPPMSRPQQPLARHPRTERRIRTVSEINGAARLLIEENLGRVWIEGEVSNFSRPGSGHWYFSLRDRSAQISCAMFASRNRFVRAPFGNGITVIVRARLSVYEARGQFQAIVEHVEPGGEGALRAAFEQLKAKLAAEGLFAHDRKQPLPAFPRHLALISSPSGAAPRDVLAVLRRRFPCLRVTWFQVSVQGDEAPGQIITALDRAQRMRSRPDAIILTRGGGSLEDLWAFNTEAVVRRVATATIPVVSAVGHETDVTLCDFAADQRAATPTAAAELATPDQGDLDRRIDRLERTLEFQANARLRGLLQSFSSVARRLVHPGRSVEQWMQRTDELTLRLQRGMTARLGTAATALEHSARLLHGASPRQRIERLAPQLQQAKQRLRGAITRRLADATARSDSSARGLHAVSPLQTLGRGYAIVAQGEGKWGSPVASVEQVATGERIRAHVADGTIEATVTGKEQRQIGDDT